MRRGPAITTTARVASFAAWVSLAVAGACSDDETLLGDAPPTEIAVDPLEFLGDLTCSADAGAAKSYVAILTDVTDGVGFTLGAGPPSACSSRMAFRFISVGHEYTAEVDIYDVPASELFPAGGAASGSRVMHDASGAVVAPRWRTQCGTGPSGGAVSVPSTSVVVAGCTPIEGDGTGITAIRVDPTVALPDVIEGVPTGDLACRADGGAIDTIAILPSGPASETPPPPVTLACGDAIVFDQGLAAGESYAFRLEAREADSDAARWAATCTAIAAEGIERTAECSPFTSAGTISITTASFDEAGFACGNGYETFDLVLEGETDVEVPRTACDGETLVAPLAAGPYTGTLRTYAAGVPARTATCEALVAPATTTSLDCSFD
jgi:hypothetical protein